ncbi:MAG: hypothetical protein EBT86_05920 [Actinobacteria bacterium]|nr:hypothetical protein [Actinomycetota bacterium]
MSRKKIAVLLTGHLRTYLNNFHNLKTCLLNQHDADIYVSTWDLNYVSNETAVTQALTGGIHHQVAPFTRAELKDRLSIYPNLKGIFVGNTNDVSVANKQLIKKYKPYGVYTESRFHLYLGGRVSDEAIENIAYQWYLVQEGFKMIGNAKKYDHIIRIRFDCILWRPITFIDADVVLEPAIHHSHLYEIRDCFFYGKPVIKTVMERLYKDMIWHLVKFNNLPAETIFQMVVEKNSKNKPVMDYNMYIHHTYSQCSK